MEKSNVATLIPKDKHMQENDLTKLKMPPEIDRKNDAFFR